MHSNLLSMVWLLAAITFVSSLFAIVTAHVAPAHVHSFTISPTDVGSYTVKAPNQAECTFKYTTQTTKVTEQKKAITDLNTILSGLQDSCISAKLDFWDYEICFSGSVKQMHGGDVYVLGRQATIEGKQQVYKNGDICEAMKPEQKPRHVTVSFACKPNAMTPAILSVQETSMCQYDMLVGTNQVCGDSAFSIVNGDEGIQNPGDQDLEDWFLEIAELSDGSVMCSAYSLEYRSTSSRLVFTEFDLKVRNPHQSQSPLLKQYTVRHPGRIPLDKQNVAFEPGHVSNSPQFTGKIAYIKAYA